MLHTVRTQARSLLPASLAASGRSLRLAVMETNGALPAYFCWTRFGTEAGETIEEILARKEIERVANQGVFLWGIGNSVAAAIRELLALDPEPTVLFSPIKSRPRPVDVSPAEVIEYRVAESLDGHRFALPPTFHVRGGISSDGARPRYALVCRAGSPLLRTESGSVAPIELVNLLSGAPLGASQVTAVVRRASSSDDSAGYPIALRAQLVPPYFLRLHDPGPLQDIGRDPIPTGIEEVSSLAQLSLWAMPRPAVHAPSP